MIKSVTITNHLNESITLELQHPDKTGIFVRGIEGLGPGQATINISDNTTNDGGTYNSARLGVRNIVFDLGFMFKPTIEHIRQKTYKYFPIKKRIKMVFVTDNRTSEIYGNVESNEPDIFSSDEGCQISVLCSDPYFYSGQLSTTVFSGVEAMFEFPFSNESLTEDLIEISRLRIDQEQTVLYEGEADVGILIYIHAIGEATNVTIYNATMRASMRIDSAKLIQLVGSDIQNRDDIIISTIKGDKYVTLIRDGVSYNILNALDKNADWFTLSKGDNIFVYTSEKEYTNLQFRIENRIAYEGV